jgi:hypothetical protein
MSDPAPCAPLFSHKVIRRQDQRLDEHVAEQDLRKQGRAD